MIVASPFSLSPAVVTALSMACALAYLAAAGLTHARARVGRSGALVLGIAGTLHAATVLYGQLPPPHFGFAPALSMTALLALMLYALESIHYPLLQLLLRWRLALAGAGTVLLAWAFPGSPMHPEAARWLPLHLAFAMASYGLFALAVVHAWLMQRAEQRMRDGHALAATETGAARELPLLTLERLTFRFVLIGFVLLTITIAQGVFFSEYLYGKAFSGAGVAHKTVFAVLSWLVFAVLIWGRLRLGWRGQRAVRMVYVGAAFSLLSYVGTEFVLQVLLQR